MSHTHLLASLLLPLSLTAGAGASPVPYARPWHKQVVYQIYPRSFADTDGDGVGDLRGITSKIDYLQRLGVDAVWLSPVYRSPNYDNGYDISDYLDIDPSFGTLADWEALRDTLHARGMKLIMDLVVNHTSDSHPWFLQEQRLKTLERQLGILAPPASDAGRAVAFGTAVGTLLHGGAPAVDTMVDAPYEAARKLVASFRAESARALPAGYPSLEAQLGRLGDKLFGNASQRRAALAENHDFYIWREHANNWTSLFGGPAWHAVEPTGLYYMAEFSVHQPDLNWANPAVRKAISTMVHTWIERGVDGFRMDVIDFIAKDHSFPDAQGPKPPKGGFGMEHFVNRAEAHAYVRELVREIRQRGLQTVGEVPGVSPAQAVDYTAPERAELGEVFLFGHVSVDRPADRWDTSPFVLTALKTEIAAQQRAIHGRGWIANYLENHDQVRVVSRFGDPVRFRVESSKMLATLLFTLEGRPYIYQGQEIGMTDTIFREASDIRDVEARNFYVEATATGMDPNAALRVVTARSRDNTRTPMQWNASANAGFSSHTPWLAVNTNYPSVNVDQAVADAASPWHVYEKLIHLRRDNDVLVYGAFDLLWPEHERVMAYTRKLGKRTAWVLLNFSGEAQPLPSGDRALDGAKRVLFDTYGPAAPTDALRPFEARILVNEG
ncbi:MAG TPA: alpha-glucosidase [Myxococcota bacterium]|nr:alpha-glucosidase [Myxococcota bacterium]